jgi:hypothetical protein
MGSETLRNGGKCGTTRGATAASCKDIDLVNLRRISPDSPE